MRARQGLMTTDKAKQFVEISTGWRGIWTN